MNKLQKSVLAVSVVAVSGVASATSTAPDFTGMTGGIDLSTAIAAVLAVGVISVNFNVAKGGAKAILGFIRSAVK